MVGLLRKACAGSGTQVCTPESLTKNIFECCAQTGSKVEMKMAFAGDLEEKELTLVVEGRTGKLSWMDRVAMTAQGL